MTFACRSCRAELVADDLLVVGALLVCARCGIDCRCPPEGAPALDPIEQLDHHQGDRGRVRYRVLMDLGPVAWSGELTIGELKDGRCTASKHGNRCERACHHHGPHHSGEWSWAGRAMYA